MADFKTNHNRPTFDMNYCLQNAQKKEVHGIGPKYGDQRYNRISNPGSSSNTWHQFQYSTTKMQVREVGFVRQRVKSALSQDIEIDLVNAKKTLREHGY